MLLDSLRLPNTHTNAFIANFNELETFFKKCLKDQEVQFTAALSKLSMNMAVVRRYKEKLQTFARLRNAIIHDEKYPDRIIAVPHPEIVSEFNKIISDIKSPKKAGAYCSKNLRIFNLNTSLAEALRYMKENSYSQLVVGLPNSYSLLTAESITCWLEDNIDELLDFSKVNLEMVLSRQPDLQCHDWIHRNASIFDAHEAFSRQFEKAATGKNITFRLYALIVTETGQKHEKPLGLLTTWDIVEFIT